MRTPPHLPSNSAPSSSSAQAPPLAPQELLFYSPSDSYQHVGFLPQGPQYGAQRNARAFDCPSIQITSIAPNSHTGQEALAAGGAEGGGGVYPEAAAPSWSRGQLYLPLDPCYRDPALCPSPCSSLSSRSWMSDVSSCESFSHGAAAAATYYDDDHELSDAARLALGSPVGSPIGSPGCGGGAFGVELWQQKYQHPAPFSPALSPHQSPRQSPRQSPCHSPRTSVTEETWLSRRPTSRYDITTAHLVTMTSHEFNKVYTEP